MIPRELVALMERRRLVAEIRTDTAIQALSVVDALALGGVTTMEISLTIPGAQEILTHLAARTDIIVGAGAVLDTRQAEHVISCGARFIASPVFAPELVAPANEAHIACILGALTPSEILQAQRAGAEMVKLFPAEALGGPMYVRALLTQLTHVSLQIAGGFSIEHLLEYLALPVRTLALGSLLTPRALYERSAWQAITGRARAFVEFAANPHANAARFLAALGIAPTPAPAQQYQNVPYQQPMDARGVVAAVPTMPVAPSMVAAAQAAVQQVLAQQAQQAAQQSQPAASSRPDKREPVVVSGFLNEAAVEAIERSNARVWNSQVLEQGDDEDWLR